MSRSSLTKVTKAIIPIAGLGTRLLPQTKSLPKEMLPILDKPVTQYIVEEAVAAGITEILLVVGEHERLVKRHFESNPELEDKLRQAGKESLAEKVADISKLAKFTYVKDEGPYGNAMPVLNAASHFAEGEPFLLFWADDFFISKVPRAQQLIDKYNQYGCPVIALIPIEPDQASSYGIPSIAKAIDETTFELDGLVEKPAVSEAPSSFASVGGYLLTPEIIPIIEELVAYHSVHGGEIYLTEAIDKLSRQSRVLGTLIEGDWHDTGTRAGYFRAILDVGLADPELRDIAKNLLRSREINKIDLD